MIKLCNTTSPRINLCQQSSSSTLWSRLTIGYWIAIKVSQFVPSRQNVIRFLCMFNCSSEHLLLRRLLIRFDYRRVLCDDSIPITLSQEEIRQSKTELCLSNVVVPTLRRQVFRPVNVIQQQVRLKDNIIETLPRILTCYHRSWVPLT